MMKRLIRLIRAVGSIAGYRYPVVFRLEINHEEETKQRT
jgi:hypothetical protein